MVDVMMLMRRRTMRVTRKGKCIERDGRGQL